MKGWYFSCPLKAAVAAVTGLAIGAASGAASPTLGQFLTLAGVAAVCLLAGLILGLAMAAGEDTYQ